MWSAFAGVVAVALGVIGGSAVIWRATHRRRDRYWSAVDDESVRRVIDRGASAVEYGLLVAGIAAVIVGITFAMGGVVKEAFGKVSTSIEKCSPEPGKCPP